MVSLALLSSYRIFHTAVNIINVLRSSRTSGRYFCPIVTKFRVSRQIFARCPNIKFDRNPSSRMRVDTCGQVDGHTDTMKLKAVSSVYVDAPKMSAI
jgi:hypothetical protein